MKSDEIKQEIEQWIANGCDYDLGVKLYGKYGRNKTLMKIFPGREKTMATKLKYELCKAVGISHLTTIQNLQTSTIEKNPVDIAPILEKRTKKEAEKPIGSIFSRIRNLFK